MKTSEIMRYLCGTPPVYVSICIRTALHLETCDYLSLRHRFGDRRD